MIVQTVESLPRSFRTWCRQNPLIFNRTLSRSGDTCTVLTCLGRILTLNSPLASPQTLCPCSAGLHCHHIPPPALDGRALGVWGQQEPEPWRAPGGTPLGPRHVYRRLQEILPPRHHRREPTDPDLSQRDRPLRSEVGEQTHIIGFCSKVELNGRKSQRNWQRAGIC